MIGNNPLYDTIYDGKWLTTGENYAHIHRLTIGLDDKGTGTGLKLFQKSQEVCMQTNVDSIRGETSSQNKLIVKYLEGPCGYTRCGKLKNQGKEFIAFEKILSKPKL